MTSVRIYHEEMKWHARLFLLMPDHVHALLSFPQEKGMVETMGNWKRYTARAAGIKWQKNFFEHRIRNDENWELKARYIRENPVRKRLVDAVEDWPHVFIGA